MSIKTVSLQWKQLNYEIIAPISTDTMEVIDRKIICDEESDP